MALGVATQTRYRPFARFLVFILYSSAFCKKEDQTKMPRWRNLIIRLGKGFFAPGAFAR